MTRYTNQFAHYLRNTRAASALEYAILVGIIAVVTSAAIVAFAPNITKAINAVSTKVGGLTVTDGIK